ncbi:CHASE3 domain-containing protein [Phormidium sp. LEGE 05292]|uniref:methyl-accepting chemotaxis protein n=1 Tax=[Phormidium] sp. LEGE 05292 TaxID=767427 RepID=UPI0018805EC5|nr:methyl-accepting chemotaxis protein [Phormidium sp. LEGE 05292]MBE9226246.1 CHASE3 domain-containing protein [Phormidium sp. LEGE 05292]
MFTNLKLRNRMLLGYGVPIILFIGLAGLIYSSTNKLALAFDEVKRNQEIIDNSSFMRFSYTRKALALRGYVVFGNNELINDYQNWQQQFTEYSAKVKLMVTNSQQKKRWEKMVALSNRYNQLSNSVINLIQIGKQAEAISLLKTQQEQSLVNNFRDLSKEFNEAETKLFNQATNEAEKVLNNLIAAVLTGSILCLSFSLVAAFLISSGITSEIDKAVNAIAASSKEIASTVEQQERTATYQATAVNQTTTTMDELGISSQRAASQAATAATTAKEVLLLAVSGNEAVEETQTGILVLKAKVSSIAEQTLILSQQTNQIASISNLVSALANQTNMLALNAAVEAVRAGEQGKGFGVVAAEIRKLADESKKSADKINSLVAEIQNAINSTVMATEEGTKTVEYNTKNTRKTAETFTNVSESINNIVLSVQQISLSAKEQSAAIQQVVDAMNSLNQAAAETAIGISKTRISTQQLNEATMNLKNVI